MAQISKQLRQEHNWIPHGDRIEITTSNVEQTLSLLMTNNVSLEGLHIKSANLDDLFLKLTGHSLATDTNEINKEVK